MTLDLLEQCAKTLLALGLGFVLLRVIARLQLKMLQEAWLPPTLGLIISALVRWLVIGVGALIVLEINGMPLKVVLAGLFSITLVVAIAFFASWSVLSNIFSSILLLIFSRIQVGDVVELRDTRRDEPGVRGRIIDINAFFVTLEELELDGDFGHKPPQVQIPSHFFFYRTMRLWPGENTRSLKDAFENNPPSPPL